MKLRWMALLLALPAQAQIYNCGGTFQDIPCAGGEVVQLTDNNAERGKPPIIQPAPEASSPTRRTHHNDSVEEAVISECFELYKPRLHDPRSAYLNGYSVTLVEYPEGGSTPFRRELNLNVHSRVLTGGYKVVSGVTCVLTPMGYIDQQETRVHLASWVFRVD
jgi:hypothetical protein